MAKPTTHRTSPPDPAVSYQIVPDAPGNSVEFIAACARLLLSIDDAADEEKPHEKGRAATRPQKERIYSECSDQI